MEKSVFPPLPTRPRLVLAVYPALFFFYSFCLNLFGEDLGVVVPGGEEVFGIMRMTFETVYGHRTMSPEHTYNVLTYLRRD